MCVWWAAIGQSHTLLFVGLPDTRVLTATIHISTVFRSLVICVITHNVRNSVQKRADWGRFCGKSHRSILLT